MKTLIHIVHLRLKEKPLPNSMYRRRSHGERSARMNVPELLVMHTTNKAAIRIVFLTIVLTVAGCNRLTPAGFWKSYRSNFIVYKTIDQGLWGGDRVIHWVSEKAGTFSEEETLEYAKKHGWVFLERIELSSGELEKWKGFRVKQVFILINGSVNYDNDSFPRHISEDAVLLKFDSKWIREDPGTGQTSTAYGYVLISKNGQKMAIYHRWGNG
jgi:hypothetical protein